MASIDFLNVDLDLESKHDLTPLIENFGENVSIMNHEQGEANKAFFELGSMVDSPDRLVLEYGSLVDHLPEQPRLLWDSCSKRVLDLGFECEDQVTGAPISLTEILSIESTKLLSRLNIIIVITIYVSPVDKRPYTI